MPEAPEKELQSGPPLQTQLPPTQSVIGCSNKTGVGHAALLAWLEVVLDSVSER